MKKNLYEFLLIFLAGVFFRILFLLDYSSLPVMEYISGPDVSEYYDAAQRILSGDWLWSKPGIHAPLYPYLLALLLRLCSGDLLWTRLLQSSLCLFLILLPVYGMLKRRSAGLTGAICFLPAIAILILALYPPFVIFQCDLFSENLMLPMLLFSIWSLYWKVPCSKGISGIFAGLAAAAHPGCVFFFPFTLVSMVFPLKKGWRKILKNICLWSLGAALVLLPITAYNTYKTRKMVFVQENSIFNLWLGNHKGSTGTCMIPPGIRWDREFARADKAAKELNCSREMVFCSEIMRFIFHDPLEYAGLLFRKAAMTLSAREFTTWSDVTPLKLIFWHRYLHQGWFIVLLLLGGASFLTGVFNRHFRHFFFPEILLFCSIFAGQVFFVTAGRYRMPLIVPLAVSGAYFLCRWPRFLATPLKGILNFAVMFLLFAIAVYPHALPSQPERDYAKSVLGGAYLKAKNPVAAIQLYSEDPEPDAFPERRLSLLGQAYYLSGDLKRAEKYFSEAVIQFPEQAENWLNQASVLSDTRHFSKALFLLAEARKRAVTEAVKADIEYNTGEIFHRAGQYSIAEKHYLKALESVPLHRKALNNLGAVYIKTRNPEKALHCFTKAAMIEPENRMLQVNRALALAMLNRKTEAAGILHEILKRDPQCKPAEQLLQMMKE